MVKKFLELPNSVPSHDTFARVFAQINPQQFQSCFLDWMKSIQKITPGEVVAIDGKCRVILMIKVVTKVQPEGLTQIDLILMKSSYPIWAV